MPTDLTMAMARKAEAKRDSDADVTIASIWLALYLIMFVGMIADSFFARTPQFATLY